MNLDAKLLLSNKLVDDLKCENESLKMHVKCLIAKPIAKNEENLCCNHILLPDFVLIVCSTSNDKSVYIPLHKRNQKVERKAFKPKLPFRSQSKVLDGFKFVSICHHYGVISHIRSQCPKLKRKQNHITRSLSKKPSGPKYIVCHNCGAFSHLRPHSSKFQALKRIKRKKELEFFGSCAMKAKPVLGENGKLLKKVFDVLTSLSICISGSQFFNPLFTYHETLISNNCSVWMRKGSYGKAYAFLVFNLILLIFVGPFMH